MDASSARIPPTRLPVRRRLTLAYVFSLVVALLVAAASVGGLLYPAQLYPTETLRHASMANDVVNLIIGLPILLGSMWLTCRGSLLGLLSWPGALFYTLYNAIAYVFGLPMNAGFLLSLVVLTVGVYALVGLLTAIDGEAVKRRLEGDVSERLSAGVLVGLGVAFSLRALVLLSPLAAGRTTVSDVELPVLMADLLTGPAWVIGGVLIWRHEPYGYVTGAGLLFHVTLSFVGLIVVMLLQPFFGGEPFFVVEIAVVAAMGLIAFVPFGLFLRGVGLRGA